MSTPGHQDAPREHSRHRRRWIDVRPHEHRPLLAAIAFALLAVASAIVGRAAGDALFLTAYPIDAVPKFFIISNAVFIGASMVYSIAVRIVRPAILNVSIVALFAASMAVGRIFVPDTGATTGLYAVCVWLAVAPALLNILCWNSIADAFDSRQARRLVPIVFAGCTCGAIGAGVGLSPWISVFGVENLLYALAGLIALCIPLPLLLVGSSRSDAPGRSATSFLRERRRTGLAEIVAEGVATVARSRLLRTLAAIVFLAALVTNLVDFAFKGVLQARFTREEIGIFYGWFNAVANTGNLFLQLFVVAWAIDRFGIARVFRFLPVTLLAGTVMLGLWPGFLMIVALKFADGLLRFTFQSSANEVAIAPIPYLERNRAKIFIKGAMNPLGAIAAGLLLLPFEGERFSEPFTLLFGVLLAALALWLWVLRGVGRAHAQQLYDSLRKKQLERTPVPEEDELFGARDTGSLMASSMSWSNLSNEFERSAEDRRRRVPPGVAQVAESERQARSSEPTIERVESGRRYPEAGLSDSSPVVRKNGLEVLAARVRRGDVHDIDDGLLEGLLWREIELAYALHQARLEVSDVGSRPGRRAARLLGQRVDDCIYRIFLTLGLLGDFKLARTAFFGLRADVGRTRAHAVDLVDATLQDSPFHRPVLLLVEELGPVARLARARRELELPHAIFDAPHTVLMDEHDPQLNRLLLRLP